MSCRPRTASCRPRRTMTRRLPRVLAALSAFAAAATVSVSVAAADPSPTDPPQVGAHKVDPQLSHRIQQVTADLDRLSQQTDQLDEKYNVAAASVTAAQHSVQHAQAAADRAAAQYRAAHARFVQALTQQYENGPGMSVGALLSSASPQEYLDNSTMVNYLSRRFAATVRVDQTARAQANAATHQAAAALAAARTKEAALTQQRAALRHKAKHFGQLLDTLTKQQQRELAQARARAAAQARAELAAQQRATTPPAGSAPRSPAAPTRRPPAGPVSGSVQQVIAFAEAQVGKAYSFAGTGPNAYDCSGLTMTAWAQAGVQLPHSAAQQYNYGTHVSYSQLQPGDLIFLYSPIGHVELYVGHDLAVSAANPSTGIVYVHPSQDMANFTGATRLTG